MNPEIRPYVNGHSETNSLHVHVYVDPSDSSKLLANTSWDRITDAKEWKHATIANKEEVESVDFARERARRYAIERSIPVVFVQDDSQVTNPAHG